MGCYQFCQLCKDCAITSKMFPLSLCESLFTETCALVRNPHSMSHWLTQIKTAELPLKQFFALLVKLAMKR